MRAHALEHLDRARARSVCGGLRGPADRQSPSETGQGLSAGRGPAATGQPDRSRPAGYRSTSSKPAGRPAGEGGGGIRPRWALRS
jgi:hypothetical protein